MESEIFDVKAFVEGDKKKKTRAKPKAKVEPKRKSYWKLKALLAILAFTLFVAGVAYAAERYVDWRAEHEWQLPIAWVGFVREIEVASVTAPVVEITAPEVTEELPVAKQIWTGQASYYSFDGCLGCNPNRIMANGEVLDDMKKTIAFNKLPMNTEVVVTNLSNGTRTTAVVTDTGGFEELGRIADLSVATKTILGCNDLCQVRIELF